MKLFYNGEVKGKNGVGVILSEEKKKNVVGVDRISDRLMSVKVAT